MQLSWRYCHQLFLFKSTYLLYDMKKYVLTRKNKNNVPQTCSWDKIQYVGISNSPSGQQRPTEQ